MTTAASNNGARQTTLATLTKHDDRQPVTASAPVGATAGAAAARPLKSRRHATAAKAAAKVPATPITKPDGVSKAAGKAGPSKATGKATADTATASDKTRRIDKMFRPAITWRELPGGTPDKPHLKYSPGTSCLKAVEEAVERIINGTVHRTCRDGSPLSPATIANNRQYLKTIRKVLGTEDLVEAILVPQRTADRLAAAITTASTLSVVATTMLAVLSEAGVDQACNELLRAWRRAVAPLRQAAKSKAASSVPSPSQQLKRLDWDKDVLARERAMRASKRRSTATGEADYLLLAVNSLHPPRRTADYNGVLLVGPKTAGKEPSEQDIANAAAVLDLRLTPAKLTVNAFKTAKSCLAAARRVAEQAGEDGEDEVAFQCRLLPALDEAVRNSLERFPRRFMFPIREGKPDAMYSCLKSYENWTVRRFKKIFNGKPSTMNDLRHSFNTWLFQQGPSLRQAKHAAHMMSQSLEMQAYYRQIDEETKIAGLDV
jgi:hypothetical protein